MPDGPNLDFLFVVMIFAISFPFVLLTLDRGVRAIRNAVASRQRGDTARALVFSVLFSVEIGLLVATWQSYTTEELHRSAPRICASNVRELGNAIAQYQQDNDDAFPSSSKWADAIAPYTKDRGVFHCPMSPTPYGYAMNDKFSGTVVHNSLHVDRTVLLFETDLPGRNAHGELGNVAGKRHYGKSAYAFIDGRVRFLSVEDVAKLNWKSSTTQLTLPSTPNAPR